MYSATPHREKECREALFYANEHSGKVVFFQHLAPVLRSRLPALTNMSTLSDAHGPVPGAFRRILKRIIELGDLPHDSEAERTEHHFLVYMGLLMSVGGLIWGSIAFSQGLTLQALIPYGYAVLTALNFIFFHASKRFKLCRFFQVLISMLLPFLFQWSLGGFIPSGAVMLWSLISLAGSLTFQDARLSLRWLGAFLVLTVFSGIIDGRLQGFQIQVEPGTTTLFFVLNISIIATIVFVLNVYLLTKRDEAREKLSEMSSVLKKMFGQYLSTTVMNALIENPAELELGGKRRKVTIMMTDLRGFTALSERLEPEQVVQLLNTYFEIMVDLVLKYNGTINEFIGDSLLVIFGAPQKMPDQAQRAVACAIEMQNAMEDVNVQNRAVGLPELEMGIGLHETEVVVGNIGSRKRSKYAVVGSGVNLASRIESFTVGGQILASASVFQEVGDMLRIDAQRRVFPKGAESALQVYEIGGIGGHFNLALARIPQALTPLVRHIPLRCTLVEEKKMGEQWLEGHLVRLSKQGAEIRLPIPVEMLTNLGMRLTEVDERLGARSFYGKVIREAAAPDTGYMVSFTSVPPEIAAYFQACQQYATVGSTEVT